MIGKCPECNRIFLMKTVEKRLARKENIKILETLTQPGFRGEIQTKLERFVPGERKFYDVTYKCRLCGAEHTKTLWKDSKIVNGTTKV